MALAGHGIGNSHSLVSTVWWTRNTSLVGNTLSPKEVAGPSTAGPRPRYGDRWIIGNEIRPADLFCYLGGSFGPPNGIQNFLRSDDSDNLIHWEWTLRTPKGFVDILGLNFRTEILLGSAATVSEGDKEELVRLIKEDLGNYGPGMTKVRRMLEPWTEFVNPYQRLHRAIEQLFEQLDALELLDVLLYLEQAAMRELSTEGQQARWKSIAARYSQATGLCFGIRSMLPVMAEAFIEHAADPVDEAPDTEDERLRENAIRQPIDVRVKSLSITCEGFRTPVDFAAEPCKKYNSLVNERNDLLHGNVVLSKWSSITSTSGAKCQSSNSTGRCGKGQLASRLRRSGSTRCGKSVML